MKRLLITLLFCGLITIGFSQTVAKIENIKILLELTGAGKMGVQAADNMLTSFKTSYKEVPEQFWIDFKKELNPAALVNLMIPIYDKYYTEDDIKQLTDFYQTPIGKKVIFNTPFIMQESMQAGQSWGQKIGEKVIENLKVKGYLQRAAACFLEQLKDTWHIKIPDNKCDQGFLFLIVTRPGFEPRQAESESAVLPLYYRAIFIEVQI